MECVVAAIKSANEDIYNLAMRATKKAIDNSSKTGFKLPEPNGTEDPIAMRIRQQVISDEQRRWADISYLALCVYERKGNVYEKIHKDDNTLSYNEHSLFFKQDGTPNKKTKKSQKKWVSHFYNLKNSFL